MDDTNQDIKIKAFKVIIVGYQSVGKSSLLNQLVSKQFGTAYEATVGIDYNTYLAQVGDTSYSLQIWDTAGQEKFRSLTSAYFRGSNACICVYDLNDTSTLVKCDYFLEKAFDESIPKSCIFLIGNKKDLA
jgi:small GTP-binding protein